MGHHRAVRRVVGSAVAVGTAILVLLAGAAAGAGTVAGAGTGDDGGGVRKGDTSDDAYVVLNGWAFVPAGDEWGSVFVLSGGARIEGDVDDDVIVLNGDVVVGADATVGGDVVAATGRAEVRSGATVVGDVRSSDRPIIEPGARVEGEVHRTDRPLFGPGLGVAFWILGWLAFSLAALAVGALFLALAPRGARAALDAARTAIGPAIGWGVLGAFVLPVGGVIVLITLIGLPLGLAALGLILPLFLLSLAVSAMTIGRALLGPDRRWLGFLLGWLILRAVDLVPVAGFLVTIAAGCYGFGALLVAMWRARREPADRRVAEPTASER